MGVYPEGEYYLPLKLSEGEDPCKWIKNELHSYLYVSLSFLPMGSRGPNMSQNLARPPSLDTRTAAPFCRARTLVLRNSS